MKVAAGAVVLAGLAGGGAAWATAGGTDGTPLSGSDLDQATSAALAQTGGGKVIEAEAGDDGAAFSIEVRRTDGSTVEVSLDKHFNVLGQESDDDGAGDESSGASDD
jgi:hypothetical protein